MIKAYAISEEEYDEIKRDFDEMDADKSGFVDGAEIAVSLKKERGGQAQSDEEVAAALEVQKLSADTPIELLSQDPEAFFGRTTQTLAAGVEPVGMATVESRPAGGSGVSAWALVVPGVVAVAGGSLLVCMALWRGRRCVPMRQRAAAWASKLRVVPAAQRYARQP